MATTRPASSRADSRRGGVHPRPRSRRRHPTNATNPNTTTSVHPIAPTRRDTHSRDRAGRTTRCRPPPAARSLGQSTLLPSQLSSPPQGVDAILSNGAAACDVTPPRLARIIVAPSCCSTCSVRSRTTVWCGARARDRRLLTALTCSTGRARRGGRGRRGRGRRRRCVGRAHRGSRGSCGRRGRPRRSSRAR